jgi:uncharacterized protein
MIGFVPLPTQLLRIDAAVSTGLGKITGAFRSYSSVGFLVAGSKWGFFPCVMLHCGAVLCHVVALLAQRGRDVRLWTSTLLPVMGAGLGVPWLRLRAKPPWLQKVVGLAIFTLGIASTFRAAAIAEWCRVG